MFMYAKLKLAAAAVAASLIVGGSGVVLFAQAGGGAGQKAPATGNSTPAPAPAANASSVAEFDDGVLIECLGVRRLGKDESWWYPDGSLSAKFLRSGPQHQRAAALAPDAVSPGQRARRCGCVVVDQSERELVARGRDAERREDRSAYAITIPGNGRDAVDITCKVASGEWETALMCEHLDATSCGGGKFGGVIIAPVVDAANPSAGGAAGALVTVSHDVTNAQYRVLAIDDSGVEHVASVGNSAIAGHVHQNLYHFDVPVERLRTISFQVRPFDHEATFGNVTLDPQKKTDVRIRVRKISN